MIEGLMAKVDEILRYVLAGKAIFTIVSKKTGKRMTFQVKQHMVEHKPQELWFVGVMTGSDNNKFQYIGAIQKYKGFILTKHSPTEKEAAIKIFRWWWYHIPKLSNNIVNKVDFYHSGRCGRCGRLLTVPSSIITGIGPKCLKNI